MPTLFISGTDTGCGKTHITAALLHRLNQAGHSAVGFKPVASGCERTPQGLRNEDALLHQQYSAPGFSYQEINPLALEPAIAPHLAAADIGQQIALEPMLQGAAALAARADWVLVEGAGGFLVPLNAQQSFADLLARAGWPVILVVGMRLGCINHALLSVEAIASRAPLLGWVANLLPPQQERWQDNVESLRQRIAAPCLGVVSAADIPVAGGQLDLSLLEKIAGNPPLSS